MTASNNKSQAVAYFNVHTEGLGYLDSLVRVSPKPGQDFEAFWSASFCMLEGDPKSPDKTYVSLTVPGEKALEDLTPFLDTINDQTTKVFVGLKLAKYRGKPFTFAADSQSPGKLGVNYSARLISVMYLKVGDTVIKLKREEATTDYGVTASQGAVKSSDAGKRDLPIKCWPFYVQLSENDMSSQELKVAIARLKDEGYIWNGDKNAWILPEVKLEKSDTDFQSKMAALKEFGYRWNRAKICWSLSANESQQSRSQSWARSTGQQATYQQH